VSRVTVTPDPFTLIPFDAPTIASLVEDVAALVDFDGHRMRGEAECADQAVADPLNRCCVERHELEGVRRDGDGHLVVMRS